jgi:pimeloyl-ACP methyl ester carboxylesterase
MALPEGIAVWFRSPRPTSRAFDVAAVLLLVGGVLGVIIHGALLNTPGPGVVLYPHFFGLWLAVFVTFYALQLLWQYHLSVARPRFAATASYVHYVALDLIAGFIFLGACVGWRADGAVWSIFLLACLLLNTLLAWHRFRAATSESTTSMTPIASSFTSSGSKARLEGGESSVSAETSSGDGVSVGRVDARTLRALTVCNSILLSLALIFMALLLSGTWVQAAGYRRFPPVGAFYPVTFPNGATVSVMAYCTGPRNATLPTFFFDIGGGGHSSTDLLGLQQALNDLGRRVCTYDYPGCGWSSYAVSVSQPALLTQLATALNEPGPFILIGTMDGGPERVYAHALAHPSQVVAVVPIAWGVGEFIAYQQTRNLSDAQALNYAQSTVAGRRLFGNIIRGLGVSWGLMNAFVPPSSTFVPQSRVAEKDFINLYTEKQWTTQVMILADQVARPAQLLVPDLWETNRTLAATIPVFDFFNQPNVTAQCIQNRYAIPSADCDVLFHADALNRAKNEAMVNMTAGSELVVCNDCKGFLSGDGNLSWLVSNLMRLVGNITVTATA